SAYGFSEQWLGRSLSAETIRDLTDLQSKHQISPVGEGGEYETLVLDAPFFKKRMRLVETEIVWEKQSGYLHVTKALLVEK
ncbi:TIGR00289 family protein, partial [Candidatus Bathyarchaeota archaeon]|nr:TIGR00289 family protein [Candidatus Bathyarchaeota archaeon]